MLVTKALSQDVTVLVSFHTPPFQSTLLFISNFTFYHSYLLYRLLFLL